MFNIHKKKIAYAVGVILIVVSITLGYSVSTNALKEDNVDKVIMADLISDKYKSIKIIFESNYKVNNVTVIDNEIPKKRFEISQKDEEGIKKMFNYSGYEYKGVNEDTIVFSRDIDKYRYEGNKYVIAIKESKKENEKEGKKESESRISIFKTDEDGNLDTEDGEVDETDEIKMKDLPRILIDDLPDGNQGSDVKLLKRGDEKYQFDSFEEALDGFNGMFNS